MQEQRKINWQQQALELMSAALLKNRTNMSCNMITPTEMIVRCKEDNWKVVMTEAGLFHLYHNNYVVVNQTERRFSDEYHDQNIESANLQELINYIGSYSWDKHLLAKGIEVDRKIYKFRIIENGEISRSKTLKKNALEKYTFIPFKNRIKYIENFTQRTLKKVIVNILPDGKKSTHEFVCAIDEEEKNIYIAEGVFNAHWEHIQGKNVDMSQMNAGEKSAFVGRNHKIQYTGILEPEADTQRLITQRNVALGNDRLQYILSDMDDLVHHKSCCAVEDIKYWEFDAVEDIPEDRSVCPKCQGLLFKKGESMNTLQTKEEIHATLRRGDVYYADLTGIEQSIGFEQKGKRPVLVIQNDVGNSHAPTTIVAILTSKIKRNLPTHVVISDFDGLPSTSAVCLEQIKTIDKTRLESYKGNIGNAKMQEIEKAIMVSLGVNKKSADIEEFANIYEKEDKDMTLLYNETIYDKQENDWLQMVAQHIEFYSNIEQYMSNLSLEKSKLEQEIEELLEFIEENSCNAAQGFKLYKFLRERRVRRKEIIKELQLLDAWTETIECQQMVQMYQKSIAKMQEIIEKQERKSAVHNFFEEAS